jgi:hypothetical protein
MLRLCVLAFAISLSLASSADAYRWVRGESKAGFGSDCYVLLCKPDDPADAAMAGLCRGDNGETCFIVPFMMYFDECKKLSPIQYVKKHGEELARFQCPFQK